MVARATRREAVDVSPAARAAAGDRPAEHRRPPGVGSQAPRSGTARFCYFLTTLPRIFTEWLEISLQYNVFVRKGPKVVFRLS